MSLRRSKGKLRSEPARRGELRVVAPAKGEAGKDHLGRFTRGNAAGGAKGFTASIGKMLGGKSISDAAMQQVGRDAWRMNGSVLRELPSTGAIVRANVALLSMHSAVAGFFNALALAKGLDSPDGMKAIEAGRVHGQRVSQLSVVVLDLASRMASAERPGAHDAAVQAGLRRLEEYNRRNQAEAAIAPPEGNEERDEGFVHEADEEREPSGDVEPNPEPEDSACNACGDPDPTRNGLASFCCSCGAKRRTAVRIRGEVH